MKALYAAMAAFGIRTFATAASPSANFIEQHCADCHDATDKKGGGWTSPR